MKCCTEFFCGKGGGVCCCCTLDLELLDLFLALASMVLLLHLIATNEVGNGGRGGVLEGVVVMAAAVAVIAPAEEMELRFKASRYAA